MKAKYHDRLYFVATVLFLVLVLALARGLSKVPAGTLNGALAGTIASAPTTAGALAGSFFVAGSFVGGMGLASGLRSKIPTRTKTKNDVTIQKLEQNWSRFGFFLPPHAREKYFLPSLTEQLADCHEELVNAPNRSRRSRIIARYRRLALLAALDSFRMVIQRRLANELAWVVGKLSKS